MTQQPQLYPGSVCIQSSVYRYHQTSYACDMVEFWECLRRQVDPKGLPQKISSPKRRAAYTLSASPETLVSENDVLEVGDPNTLSPMCSPFDWISANHLMKWKQIKPILVTGMLYLNSKHEWNYPGQQLNFSSCYKSISIRTNKTDCLSSSSLQLGDSSGRQTKLHTTLNTSGWLETKVSSWQSFSSGSTVLLWWWGPDIMYNSVTMDLCVLIVNMSACFVHVTFIRNISSVSSRPSSAVNYCLGWESK